MATKTAGYVIKATHRKGLGSIYFGTVPVGVSKEKGIDVTDMEIERFGSLREASLHPFQDADHAAYVVASFPETKNLDYEVVEAEG